MDADPDCENLFIVSRGGNYVIKVQLGKPAARSKSGPRTTSSASNGQHPDRIVVVEAGKLGFVYNEVNLLVSVLDLEATGPDNVLAPDVPSSTPP